MSVAALDSVVASAGPARRGPDTVIDSGPAASSSSTSASSSSHSTSLGATLSCRLDLAAYVACTGPVAYTGLATGSHTFAVLSTASAGIDLSAATLSWQLGDSDVVSGRSYDVAYDDAAFAISRSGI